MAKRIYIQAMTGYAEVLLNAGGVMAIVGLTVLAAWRWRERDARRRRPVAAVVAAFIVALLISNLSAHLCDAGGAPVQIAAGALGVFVLTWAVRVGAAVPLGVIVVTLATVLAFHATDLAHRGYPTNPRYGQRTERALLLQLKSSIIERNRTQPLTAGAVPEELLSDVFDGRLTPDGLVRLPEVHWRWFTPITGMWEASERQCRAEVTDAAAGTVRFVDGDGG